MAFRRLFVGHGDPVPLAIARNCSPRCVQAILILFILRASGYTPLWPRSVGAGPPGVHAPSAPAARGEVGRSKLPQRATHGSEPCAFYSSHHITSRLMFTAALRGPFRRHARGWVKRG